MDWMSESDPVVQVFERRQQGTPAFLGQTEVVQDNADPSFVQSVIVDYLFEEEQELLLRVLDVDNDKIGFSDADLVGETVLRLGWLVAAPGQALTRDLIGKNKRSPSGVINVSAQMVAESTDIARMELGARNLYNTAAWLIGILHKPNPCLVFQQCREDGTWVDVARTETRYRTVGPLTWNTMCEKCQRLCNGDLKRPLRIKCLDEIHKHGKMTYRVIGACTTSLEELVTLDGRNLELSDPDELEIKKPRGTLSCSCNVMPGPPNLMEYLRGGLELSLHVAIDFTASNGAPQDPNSLHYIYPQGTYNTYESAIVSVGSILRDYDSDKMIPLFGFGGCPGQDLRVSHCFPLSGRADSAEVHDVDGILAAYRNSIRTTTLSGPTLFAPLIQEVNRTVMTQPSSNRLQYHILLILTDGCIQDMPATIDAIVAASALPLSIIIVGIGNADFTNMQVLDADIQPLRASDYTKQLRDNLQFVPMRDVQTSAGSLAREVLRELPEQVTTYFHQIQKVGPGAPLAHVERQRQNKKTIDLAQDATAFYGLDTAWNVPGAPSAPPP
eukprot:gnl/MRDRNA2_/MRDRNA2_189901_c0_seq1.p1 gnl/MRDRNA2_/MRDRNA2_189901_c0~~gnl/MRDRNA2_/MRDRNA2_189901_c0_seq1.p1  ORF type:complete len:556 (+),score=92.72 gnl/MRDRNA2_/MRDRNA2_189901_c0_seq1:3-1670(+)